MPLAIHQACWLYVMVHSCSGHASGYQPQQQAHQIVVPHSQQEQVSRLNGIQAQAVACSQPVSPLQQLLVKHHSTRVCRGKVASPVQQKWQRVCAHPSAQLVHHSWQLLFAHLWPLVALFSLSDGVILLLTRCSHRVTNEGAL